MNRCGFRIVGALVVVATSATVPGLAQLWIPTNVGNGADAEVRESSPTTNRGASTELGTRVVDDFPLGHLNDGSDRNSLIYLRFDLSAVTIPDELESGLRLTYRNNNLTASRLQDTVTPNPALRTGLAIYGLGPMATGGDWGEGTITYLSAPGITLDGDVGSRDLNSDLIFLGAVLFPEIGSQNHLPIGGPLVFRSQALNQFVTDVIDSGDTELTLVAHLLHGGSAPFPDWLNFNYLFNPKNQLTLNADPNYDADIDDPNNALGSPWSSADNSGGLFSPSLLIQGVTLFQDGFESGNTSQWTLTTGHS